MENEKIAKHHLGLKAKGKLSNTIIYIILTVMMIVWMIPFFCLLCDSLKCEETTASKKSETSLLYLDSTYATKYDWLFKYIVDLNEDEATFDYANQCLITYSIRQSTKKVTLDNYELCEKVFLNEIYNFINKTNSVLDESITCPLVDCTNESVYNDLITTANESGYKITKTETDPDTFEQKEVEVELTVDKIISEFLSDTNQSAKDNELYTVNIQKKQFYTTFINNFAVVTLKGTRITWQTGYILPKKIGFDNYIELFTKTSFPKWFLNTFLVGLMTAVLQTVIVLSMSYCLSRLRFKGRKLLMNFMLVLGMFPGFLSMILLYKLLSSWNMTGTNSVIGLTLVYCASSGMGYYVSKGFFDTIPRSLDEAARVDGATRFQVFYKIIMPLAKPIVIYTILTAFMAPWGDFMFASYIAHNADAGKNVAVGLYGILNSKTGISDYYTIFCAGAIIVSIPITLLFMFLQKYYVEGVTGGAVKG